MRSEGANQHILRWLASYRPANGRPSLPSGSFLSAQTRDEGYHAGKIFFDRCVVFVSLAVRGRGISGAGTGGQAGTAIAHTERGKHNRSRVIGIRTTPAAPAAPG